MSVEEARRAVFGMTHEEYYDAAEVNSALDRLILEVQAEMPCSCACYRDGSLLVLREACPSCKARAELKVPA